MPKKEIDYSKTIFYKIVCKDLSIIEKYVGHTTEYTKRKCMHKTCCNNENGKHYNLKVYKYIRENGGWNNFDMIMIEEYECNNVLEARRRERYWIETLDASLNCNIPSRTMEEWKQNNREHLLSKNKEQYNEIISNNPEHNKERYLTRRENQLEYKAEKIICECGAILAKGHLQRHLRTMKHLIKLHS